MGKVPRRASQIWELEFWKWSVCNKRGGHTTGSRGCWRGLSQRVGLGQGDTLDRSPVHLWTEGEERRNPGKDARGGGGSNPRSESLSDVNCFFFTKLDHLFLALRPTLEDGVCGPIKVTGDVR